MMRLMRILIDNLIHRGREVFSRLGEVVTYEGRSLTPVQVRDADALIVRSVTPVTADLLAGSSVCFVGTTSTGLDHLDLDGLARRGVTVASAAGCNARTVAEYVLAALLEIAHCRGEGLARLTLGVVGVGRIGRIVAEWAALFGVPVRCCDPPLAEAERRTDFFSLEDLLATCDVVTLHVPLTTAGPHATRRMIDARAIEKCNKNGLFLINTSRGEVVDEAALVRGRRTGRLTGLVVDVWSSEPNIARDTLDAATLATPHIAGVSFLARARAVRRVCEKLAAFVGASNKTIMDDEIMIRPPASLPWPVGVSSWEAALRDVVASCIDLPATDARMRDAWRQQGEKGFDRLRAGFAERREFGEVRLTGVPSGGCHGAILAKIGFQVG